MNLHRLLVVSAPFAVSVFLSWFHHRNWFWRNQCVLASVKREGGDGLPPHTLVLEGHCRKSVSHFSYEGLQPPTVTQLSASFFNTRDWTSPSMGILSFDQDGEPRSKHSENQTIAFLKYLPPSSTQASDETSESWTSLGFRRNSRKSWRTSTGNQPPFPMATGLLLFINLTIYFGLWNYRIAPSRVALNHRTFQDFGRSLTGNLSHFDLWHIGLNMMSCSSLMPLLEEFYGTIPVLLWTFTFMPLTTLVVIGLYHLYERIYLHRRRHDLEAPSFPSMVGFSGILFAWMVVSTLNGARSCPIFLLPDLCFETFHMFGMRWSLGPLVQLVVLQVLLPRVSFFGHLSGILVGFCFHWKIMPPLEWMQPSISYPVLWLGCKYFVQRNGLSESDTPTSTSSSNSGVWRSPGSSSDDASAATKDLTMMRNIMCFHLAWTAFTFGFASSTTISELLLVIILGMIVHFRRQAVGHDFPTATQTKLASLETGYISLCLVLMVTDCLSIGAWIATWSLWGAAVWKVAVVLVSQIILFAVTMGIVARVLRNDNRLEDGTWLTFIWPYAMLLEDTLNVMGIFLKSSSFLSSQGCRFLQRLSKAEEERHHLIHQQGVAQGVELV